MTNLQVHVRRRCLPCLGKGIVYSWRWEEWITEHARTAVPTEAEQKELGPEGVACPECHGTGYVEDWVPLSDLHQDCGAECDCYRRGLEEQRRPV